MGENMKYFTLAIFSLLLTACGGSDEAPEVYINSASHSGAGCPSGTGEIVLSSDKKTLSVLFEEYEAVAGIGSGVDGEADVTTSRVACNIAVSLHIPSGYQAFLIGADFRGEVTLPAGAEAKFNREYFFAADSSPILTAIWSDEVDGKVIEIFDDLYADTDSRSLCGEDVILRSNTSLSVSVPDADADTALIQIDSFDYKNEPYKTQFDYQFNFVKCS